MHPALRYTLPTIFLYCIFCICFCLIKWKQQQQQNYLLNTFISFSSESSFPLSAFLSIILTANSCPGLSLLSASLTSENAPLHRKQQQKLALLYFIYPNESGMQFKIIDRVYTLFNIYYIYIYRNPQWKKKRVRSRLMIYPTFASCLV